MVLKFSSEMAGDSRFTWLSSSWSGTVTKSSIFNAMSFCRNYYVLLSFLSVIMMFFVLPVTHALQDLHRMPPSSWTYSDGSLPNPWREYTLFQVAHPCSYTYKLTKIEEFENSFSKKFLWNSIVKNRYKKKICKISISLADSCIFIQDGTLLPTGISFPKKTTFSPKVCIFPFKFNYFESKSMFY